MRPRRAYLAQRFRNLAGAVFRFIAGQEQVEGCTPERSPHRALGESADQLCRLRLGLILGPLDGGGVGQLRGAFPRHRVDPRSRADTATRRVELPDGQVRHLCPTISDRRARARRTFGRVRLTRRFCGDAGAFTFCAMRSPAGRMTPWPITSARSPTAASGMRSGWPRTCSMSTSSRIWCSAHPPFAPGRRSTSSSGRLGEAPVQIEDGLYGARGRRAAGAPARRP